jgi:hypothetical protein
MATSLDNWRGDVESARTEAETALRRQTRRIRKRVVLSEDARDRASQQQESSGESLCRFDPTRSSRRPSPSAE